MGEFVGDDPSHKFDRATAQRPLEHHRATGAARAESDWDMENAPGAGLVVAHGKCRVFHQIAADLGRQRRNHVGRVRVEQFIQREGS